jgi:hypothetical protein
VAGRDERLTKNGADIPRATGHKNFHDRYASFGMRIGALLRICARSRCHNFDGSLAIFPGVWIAR